MNTSGFDTARAERQEQEGITAPVDSRCQAMLDTVPREVSEQFTYEPRWAGKFVQGAATLMPGYTRLDAPWLIPCRCSLKGWPWPNGGTYSGSYMLATNQFPIGEAMLQFQTDYKEGANGNDNYQAGVSNLLMDCRERANGIDGLGAQTAHYSGLTIKRPYLYGLRISNHSRSFEIDRLVVEEKDERFGGSLASALILQQCRGIEVRGMKPMGVKWGLLADQAKDCMLTGITYCEHVEQPLRIANSESIRVDYMVVELAGTMDNRIDLKNRMLQRPRVTIADFTGSRRCQVEGRIRKTAGPVGYVARSGKWKALRGRFWTEEGAEFRIRV